MASKTGTRGEVVAYRVGLVHLSACAPTDLCEAEVEEEINYQHPTGISSRWKISDDEALFASGAANGCPCEIDPTRRHWLLSC